MFITMKWYNITENCADTFWVRLRLGKREVLGMKPGMVTLVKRIDRICLFQIYTLKK